ncbi:MULTISPECIES: MarC family protein [Microvirgula]|uniref:UPF0056 membrane protein n=1 Tax=Microvirgula aerodenitrificans TaxID=57480 RepID=A0A2U3TH02_9NEIS|nr:MULTISPECIES: MarC family protein [Microvirgula]AVY92675.1 MarC family protein [Microvirgula aerodenitrificans]RAS17415.1 multiple antibiotic resistance protein [Microvirgula sp. AG722]
MLETITLFFSKVLFIIAALFPILNPPGHAPIFLSLTAHNTHEERAILARKVGIYSFVLLLAAMYVGGYVLKLFEVSLPIVQVGGGFLVTMAAWEMLTDKHDIARDQGDTGHLTRDQLSQRAFYPLTFPITVGPGATTVAITVAANLRGSGTLASASLQHVTVLVLASLVGTGLIAFSLYACYRYADTLLRVLGNTGTMVFMRLSAFILMCLGVQIIWDGLTQLVLQFGLAHLSGFVK